ncbi:aldehyde dehydrogenase family protein [Sporolactobacillus sp. THM7-7]|nr:aldehyde dehydrogenase family protein [Sporolactobacillus sp. THM7-7]
MSISIEKNETTETVKKERFMNYIDGEWKEPSTGKYIPVINPADGAVLGEVAQSSAADVDQAVQAAVKAQKKWRLVPAPERAEYLFTVGRLLKENKEKLAQIITSEMGKVIEEARGEVQEAIDMAHYMAGEGRRMFGETMPSELRNKFAMSIRVPVGVVGMITPWNFPIAIASWKSLPALVTGNALVWKPSPDTPIVAEAFVKIYEEAGLPKGLINLVQGSGPEAGAAMVEHPDIDLIGFTGSNAVGRKINERAGALLKRTSLEMGGKNAIIVMDDANLDLAVESIIWSGFGTTGQRCTAASRVIVHEAVKQQLEEKLVEAVRPLTLGDGHDETIDVGPLINKKALEKVEKYVRIGVDEGAKLLCGGKAAEHVGNGKGFFYEPTIFTDVQPGMTIAKEEIFGPVVSIITVKDLEEAIAVNNNVSFGLSSSIFTGNVNRVFQAMRDLDTGIVYINAGTTGAEIHLPFGGTKETGNGHRDSGVAALDVYTEWRAVYLDYSNTLQRAQIDTNTK